jgi:hypothetical protein
MMQAQTGTGELRGVMSSVRGPLAGLEVRIKNTSTGEVITDDHFALWRVLE